MWGLYPQESSARGRGRSKRGPERDSIQKYWKSLLEAFRALSFCLYITTLVDFVSFQGLPHLAPYNPHSLGLGWFLTHQTVCGGPAGSAHLWDLGTMTVLPPDRTRCYFLIGPRILAVGASASFSFLPTPIRLWSHTEDGQSRVVSSERVAMITYILK